jgi:hypothetical protein
MAPTVTMKDLVNAIAEHAENEAEVVATVVYLVNSGKVRLRGHLAGARFDLDALPLRARAAA